MLDTAFAARPYIALSQLALVLAAFISERWSPDMVAFLGAALALVPGLVTTDEVLAAIANPAPATIGAMFVLSAALVKTGAAAGPEERPHRRRRRSGDQNARCRTHGVPRRADIPGFETGRLRPTHAVEFLVGPHFRAVGQTLGRLRWRRRFCVYPIALHRPGSAVDVSVETTELNVGDTLLVDGAPDDLVRLCEDQGLTRLAPNTARSFRRRKAPIALGVLCAVVLLAAFDVVPILALALIGVAAILATNCIEPDEGLAAMDGQAPRPRSRLPR